MSSSLAHLPQSDCPGCFAQGIRLIPEITKPHLIEFYSRMKVRERSERKVMFNFEVCCVCIFVAVIVISTHGSSVAEESKIEVAELPTAQFTPPSCDYSVRIGERNGRPVTGSVNVGDPLYHRWSCRSTGGLYCIMVHSCTISHKVAHKPKQVEIIDEFGCSVFPELVPNMNYLNDTEAGFRANAFLIDIDQMSLAFKCSLKFLVKTDGFCRRPLCARPAVTR